MVHIKPLNKGNFMNSKFSPKVKQVISKSRDEALRLGHDYIGTEHLLLGIIKEDKGLAIKVLDSLDVDSKELQTTVEKSIHAISGTKTEVNLGKLPLNKLAEKVLKVTFLEAKMLKCDEISPEHLLLSILKHKDSLASRILRQFDVDYEIFKTELEYIRQEQEFQYPDVYASSPQDPEEPFEEESQQGRYQRKACG